MDLRDFEEYIDDTILARGWDYYQSGNVLSLEGQGGTWVAQVEGTQCYTVTAQISARGVILQSECDCPYDWGDYCKHQAAVFFAIKEGKKKKTTRIKTYTKDRLKETLKKLDRRELESIIVELADRDSRIKEELLLRCAQGEDALRHARNVVKGSIAAVKRRGFVEYSDVAHATHGAYSVLEMSDGKRKGGDFVSAVLLCNIVLDEMMDLLDCCDDSNGHVGGAIAWAIEKIGEAAEMAPSEQGAEVFGPVFDQAQKPMYDGWTHWRMDLLSALMPLCGNPANRDRMEQYLSQRQNQPADGWGREYEARQWQKMRHELILRLDGEDAAARFRDSHLENDDFRHIAIQAAMSNRQYDKALDLCAGGESLSPGASRPWRRLRYEIYEQTGNAQGQKELGSDLLLEGDFAYFPKLKALCAQDEWPCVLQKLLAALGEGDRSGVYVQILLHENLKMRLLDYCKRNTHAIDSYYSHLLPECEKEVGEIFAQLIRARAERAADRNQYRAIGRLLQHYKKACGFAALELRDELAKKYVRRPAFLDELGKI